MSTPIRRAWFDPFGITGWHWRWGWVYLSHPGQMHLLYTYHPSDEMVEAWRN